METAGLEPGIEETGIFSMPSSSAFAEAWGALWTIAALLIPMITVFGAWRGGVWAWIVPAVFVVIVPCVDGLLRRFSPQLFQLGGETPAGTEILFSTAQLLFTLAHIVVFPLVLMGLSEGRAVEEVVGVMLSFAIYGSVALGNSHDLMHRRSNWVRRLGICIQKLYIYPANFEIEHLARHHSSRWLCLPGDVESAPGGMSFYRYFYRLDTGGDIVNLEVEKARLERMGLPWRSVHNRLFQTSVARWSVALGLLIVFPIPTALCGIAMLLLASVSFSCSGYFQHYGLERPLDENGKPTPVDTKLTWDRNDPIGKYLYFGGTRHPTHHLKPRIPYWDLLREPTSEYELPYPYHQLALLALVPPLFRRVMARRMGQLGLATAGDKPRGRLKIVRCAGHQLRQSRLAGICDLGETVMTFKNRELIPRERAKMAEFARGADFAYLIEDAVGRVFGTFLINLLPSGGGRRALAQIDYMYVHPNLRGSVQFNWMLMRAGMDALRRMWGKEIWFIAVGAYPMGFRSIWKYGGQIRHSRDPNIPADVRRAMVALAAEQCKDRWIPQTHCVEIAFSPPSLPAEVMERFRREEWWGYYHAVCPNWHDGFGLIAAYQFRWRDFGPALALGIRRKLRGRK